MGKMKKILAGVGLGLVMGTSTFLAGCTSDIKFNQVDLDNMVKGAETYLETQNNYSTEFAKNMFNELLVNMYVNHYDERNVQTKRNQTTFDLYGIEFMNMTCTEKSYINEEDKVKYYVELSQTEFGEKKDYKGYRELLCDHGSSYTCTDYDLNLKTKKSFNVPYDSGFEGVGPFSFADPDGHGGFGVWLGNYNPFAILDVIKIAFSGLDENLHITNIVMDKTSETEYVFKILMFRKEIELQYQHNSILKFKDGYLVSYEDNFVLQENGNTLGSGMTTVNFEYNIADFVVDTSACVVEK